MFRILATTLALIAAGALPVASDSVQARVVRELQRLGYTDIIGKQTLLGRYRIVARSNGERREIVLNPYTGEVLRDFVHRTSQDDDQDQVPERSKDGSQGDKPDGQGGSGDADGKAGGEGSNGAGRNGKNSHE